MGAFLLGCLTGSLGVFFLTFLVVGFNTWRAGIVEGTPVIGEGIERAKRRGES